MPKKNKKQKLVTKVKTSDGGSMEIIGKGKDARIEITKGYGETPEQRLDRIQNSPKAYKQPTKEPYNRKKMGKVNKYNY